MAHSTGIRRRMLLAGVLALAASLPALAQQTGGGGGGFGGGGGSTGGGGTGGGGTGGGGFGGGGMGGQGGQGGRGAQGTMGQTAGGATRGTGTSSTGPSATNFLASTYKYPYVTGLGPIDTGQANGSEATTALRTMINDTFPAFGGPTLSASGSGTRSTTGARGTANRAGGTATIRGGGRAGGATTTVDGFNGGTALGMATRNPHYAAVINFPSAPVTTNQVLGDVRGAIARSNSLPSKGNVTVSVDGRDVTLRGQVANDDERRLIESLVRLTPGVGTISNELVVKQ